MNIKLAKEHILNELLELNTLERQHLIEAFNIEKEDIFMYNQIRLTTEYAMQYIGKWYKWGGDTPDGFDCSGLACELLKMNGLIPGGADYTAQGFWDLYLKKRQTEPAEGCFVCFFGNNTHRIVHIEYCINDWQTIGASGGGSRTVSEADAIRDKAFIKIRPLHRGRKIAGYFNPFLKEE